MLAPAKGALPLLALTGALPLLLILAKGALPLLLKEQMGEWFILLPEPLEWEGGTVESASVKGDDSVDEVKRHEIDDEVRVVVQASK